MMPFEIDDESLERELFAVRASALPTPRLDVRDVLDRAARAPVRERSPERERCLARGARAAWFSAAACAAATYLGVVPYGEPTRDDVGISSAPLAAESDGLACRADSNDLSASLTTSLGAQEPLASIAPDTRASCVAQDPSALVCAQDVTFSIARP